MQGLGVVINEDEYATLFGRIDAQFANQIDYKAFAKMLDTVQTY